MIGDPIPAIGPTIRRSAYGPRRNELAKLPFSRQLAAVAESLRLAAGLMGCPLLGYGILF